MFTILVIFNSNVLVMELLACSLKILKLGKMYVSLQTYLGGNLVIIWCMGIWYYLNYFGN